MSKVLVFLVILVAFGVASFYAYQLQGGQANLLSLAPESSSSLPSASRQTSTEADDACEVLVKGDADLPPLDGRVKWDNPSPSKEEILEYDDKLNQSTSVKEGCVIEATGVDSQLAFEFDDDYGPFLSQGWRNVMAADGPNGSTLTYEKQGKYFLIEKRIDSKVFSEEGIIEYNLKLFYSQ